MKRLRRNNIAGIIFLVALTCSCRNIDVPKPRGYFRIDLPEHDYMAFNDSLSAIGNINATFEFPVYGELSFEDAEGGAGPGWFNIRFPSYRAQIHLTYMDIRNDLAELMEQTYRLNVKNHITKADAINEQIISNPERKIYGILYDLKGNTATAVQFFATDSVRHYLRGSLYFSSAPNSDSLAPVIRFFREDIIHLIETLEWNDKKF
ncbi:MAG: gliding motility lipoprotein GldD [Bacteroidales bacterium]|nr:gliding motility lipoprotein GldD [Bacteroidales bacterium]